MSDPKGNGKQPDAASEEIGPYEESDHPMPSENGHSENES
jgi:hypothetical protein